MIRSSLFSCKCNVLFLISQCFFSKIATDHTREYVPYLICGKGVKPGVDLGTKLCFGTIAQTICDYLGVDASTLDGKSVLGDILA